MYPNSRGLFGVLSASVTALVVFSLLSHLCYGAKSVYTIETLCLCERFDEFNMLEID